MTKSKLSVVVASVSLLWLGSAVAEDINGNIEYTRSTVDLGAQGFATNGEIEANRLSGYASFQLKQQRLHFDANIGVMQGDVDPGGNADKLNISGNSIGVGAFVLDPKLYSVGVRVAQEKVPLDQPSNTTLDINSDVVSATASLYQDDINLNIGATKVNSDNASTQSDEYLAQDSDNGSVGVQFFLKNDAALVLEKGLADTRDFFAFGFQYKFTNKPYGLLLSSLKGNELETINLSLIYHFQGSKDLRSTSRNGQNWNSLILERR